MEEEEDLEIITIGDLIIIIIIRTKDSINPDLSDSDLGEVEEDSDLGEEDIKFNYYMNLIVIFDIYLLFPI